ncbi:hypothetical protein TNCV_2428871 [Trichonephila clavipes]|nr:hypothetical protein TNCV_2428871 [Trichonephila clavipes]
MLRHYMKDRGLVMGQIDRNQENSKDLGKPRVSRVTVINQGEFAASMEILTIVRAVDPAWAIFRIRDSNN